MTQWDFEWLKGTKEVRHEFSPHLLQRWRKFFTSYAAAYSIFTSYAAAAACSLLSYGTSRDEYIQCDITSHYPLSMY
jgi:hypothetical protein